MAGNAPLLAMRVMRVMAIERNRRGAHHEPIKKASSNELADGRIVTGARLLRLYGAPGIRG